MIKYGNVRISPLDNVDVLLLFFITSISLITHLWNIQFPNFVIFDEVYFGNFTNSYISRSNFYDIHPPLGKLLMYLMAYLSEYDGNVDFDGRFSKVFLDPNYVILRLTPAIYSSFCAPLIYLALRFSSFGYLSGFVSSFMMIFDTSLLTEHRFVLSDGMLHFFTCLFIAVWSYYANILPFTPNWGSWLILVGIFLGFANSCKNTAWGLMGLVGITQILQVLQYRKKVDFVLLTDIFVRAIYLFVPNVMTYMTSFLIHLIILCFNGPGDVFLDEELRSQLISNTNVQIWAKRLKGPNLYYRVLSLAVNMHFGNMGITQFHPYQSRPIGWPLLTDAFVAFWVASNDREVSCIGNVFVYYISFISICIIPFSFKSKRYLYGLRYFIGWVVCYIPFFIIPRSMFLYHYQIPLIFGCMTTGAFVDIVIKPGFRGVVSMIIVLLCGCGFYIWSSYCYGTSHFHHHKTIWNNNWIYGDAFHRKLARGG